MPPAALSFNEVQAILRSSENRPTLFEGRGQDPDGVAHALARHYLISNAGLMERLHLETRNGAFGYFSAFLTLLDMVQAAMQVLNGPAGLWAREQLFDKAATPQKARGSHTGMRAVINHCGTWICNVRYAGSQSKVMPVGQFRMILDRIDDRPHRLHIHTFFPAQTLRTPASSAEAKYRDGTLFGRWP